VTPHHTVYNTYYVHFCFPAASSANVVKRHRTLESEVDAEADTCNAMTSVVVGI